MGVQLELVFYADPDQLRPVQDRHGCRWKPIAPCGMDSDEGILAEDLPDKADAGYYLEVGPGVSEKTVFGVFALLYRLYGVDICAS